MCGHTLQKKIQTKSKIGINFITQHYQPAKEYTRCNIKPHTHTTNTQRNKKTVKKNKSYHLKTRTIQTVDILLLLDKAFSPIYHIFSISQISQQNKKQNQSNYNEK